VIKINSGNAAEEAHEGNAGEIPKDDHEAPPVCMSEQSLNTLTGPVYFS
jgi:hypothetical protein